MKTTKTFDGKKYHYFFNGKLFRNSTSNFKYACIATSRESGKSFMVSLGNNRESTLKSMAHCYAHYCDMEVVEIESENNKEIFVKVNENVIIATDQAMVDAGLFKCNPREGQITIWTYELNHVWNQMQWTPIMRVFTEPLMEDIKDEDGRVIEQKSTHKIDSFYGAPINGNLDLTRFLANRGVNVTPIEA